MLPSDIKAAHWVGARFAATIGEPWDFTSSSGNGRIEGRLCELYQDRFGTEFLAMEILPFIEAGREICRLLGAKRHATDRSLRASLEKQEKITLNMFYLKNDQNIVEKFIDINLSDFNEIEDIDFIVGTIRDYY